MLDVESRAGLDITRREDKAVAKRKKEMAREGCRGKRQRDRGNRSGEVCSEEGR